MSALLAGVLALALSIMPLPPGVLDPSVPVEEQLPAPAPSIEDEQVLLAEAARYIEVSVKQELLQDLGWYEGEVDGIYGPLTEQAVEGFVEAADIDPDPLTIRRFASSDDAPEAPPPPPPPAPAPPTTTVGSGSEAGIASHWLALADCESGEWDANANPIPGSRRWTYGITFVRPAYAQFQGGLNFHPGTWRSFKDPGMPDHAGNATPHQQVTVGERVQRAQGWGAWPVCSRKVGLR